MLSCESRSRKQYRACKCNVDFNILYIYSGEEALLSQAAARLQKQAALPLHLHLPLQLHRINDVFCLKKSVRCTAKALA